MMPQAPRPTAFDNERYLVKQARDGSSALARRRGGPVAVRSRATTSATPARTPSACETRAASKVDWLDQACTRHSRPRALTA